MCIIRQSKRERKAQQVQTGQDTVAQYADAPNLNIRNCSSAIAQSVKEIMSIVRIIYLHTNTSNKKEKQEKLNEENEDCLHDGTEHE